MKAKFLFISLSLFSICSFGQESSTTVQVVSTNAQIKAKIDSLNNISAEEFPTKVETLRTEIERFMISKKRVCDGVFSTMVLKATSAISEAQAGGRLTQEERKLCYRELKSLQIDFVNGLFTARKRYLEALHEKRLHEVTATHENALKEINRTFQK